MGRFTSLITEIFENGVYTKWMYLASSLDMSPQNSYVEALIPSVVVYGDGPLEVIGFV